MTEKTKTAEHKDGPKVVKEREHAEAAPEREEAAPGNALSLGGTACAAAASAPTPPPKSGCCNSCRAAGNLAVQSLLRAGAQMSSYEVSEPGDPYEREADAVAESVAGGGSHATAVAAPAPAARSRGGVGLYGRVQPSGAGGRPLGDSARAYFEPRMGQDLRHVRVHTDERAAGSARALGARAFTLGGDIFFGRGLYAPETTQGRRLLAHELTHVAQQSRASSPNAGAGGSAPPRIQRQEQPAGGAPAAGAPAAGGQPASDSTVFKGVPLTKNTGEVNKALRDYIAGHGLKGAREFVNEFKDHLSTEKGNRGSMSGVTPESQALEKEIERDEAIAPLLDAELKTLERESADFLTQFEAMAKMALSTMLTTSEERVTAEMERYGLNETVTTKKKLNVGDYGVKSWEETTQASYSMASNEGTKGLAAAAGELKAKLLELLPLIDKKFDAIPWWSGLFAPEGIGPNPYIDQKQYAEASEQIKDVRRQYNVLRNEKIRDYPILAAYSELPKEDATYFINSVADRLSTLASGSSPALAESLFTESSEKLKNIKTTWDALNSGSLSVWKLPAVVGVAKNGMGVAKGSMRDKLVDEKVEQVESDDATLKIALGVIALALGLLAAIPSGGSSLVAAGTFIAGVAGAGISAYSVTTGIQEYIIQSAASGTDFDKAQAISQEDPSLFWLAVDIVGAIADIKGALDGFRALKESVKAAMVARRAAQAAEELKKADDLVRLASEEAERVAPGLGKRVADDIATQAGRTSPHLDADYVRWEEGVNQQTRGYLVDHPEARATLKDMDPQVRDILTHCSPDNCIIPTATRRDAARVRAVLDSVPPEGHAKLKEYFHLRKDDLEGALKELEAAAQGDDAVKKINQLVDQTFKDLEQAPGAPPLVGTTATKLRNSPGAAVGGTNLPYVTDPASWLSPTGGQVGLIPGQVADQLRGQQFKTFDELRAAFWAAVENDPVLSQSFSPQNLARMAGQTKSGKVLAPIAPAAQQYGKIKSLTLHHIVPIEHGGGVYDLGNLVVVSPAYHQLIHY